MTAYDCKKTPQSQSRREPMFGYLWVDCSSSLSLSVVVYVIHNISRGGAAFEEREKEQHRKCIALSVSLKIISMLVQQHLPKASNRAGLKKLVLTLRFAWFLLQLSITDANRKVLPSSFENRDSQVPECWGIVAIRLDLCTVGVVFPRSLLHFYRRRTDRSIRFLSVSVLDVDGVAAAWACRHRANFQVKLGHSSAAADVVVEAASGRVNSASSCSRSPSSSAENSPPRTTTSSAKNFFSPSPLGLPVSFSKSSATARHLDRASL